MYRMTCDGFEVKGLSIDGVRKTLAYDGIKAYLTPRVLNNGPVEFRGLGGVWTVVAM